MSKSNKSKPPRQPKLCRNKANGQAFVRIRGVQIWLGKWGSEKANKAYLETIELNRPLWAGDWTGEKPPKVQRLHPPVHRLERTTVEELVEEFLEENADRYKREDGTYTGTLQRFQLAAKPLVPLFRQICGVLRNRNLEFQFGRKILSSLEFLPGPLQFLLQGHAVVK